jgi:hypothetical protein
VPGFRRNDDNVSLESLNKGYTKMFPETRYRAFARMSDEAMGIPDIRPGFEQVKRF